MRQSAIKLRGDLANLAMRQAGYFTAAQALNIGYSYSAQKQHIERGNWVRIDRGIFRIPHWPVHEEDVYVLWRLWSKDRAVISHQTALALHDLSTVNPAVIHLTVPLSFRAKDPAVVLHYGTLAVEDIEEREHGYRLTTVIRSLLDTAAGDLSQEQLNSAVVEALEKGMLSALRLRMRADTFGERAALRIERALGETGT